MNNNTQINKSASNKQTKGQVATKTTQNSSTKVAPKITAYHAGAPKSKPKMLIRQPKPRTNNIHNRPHRYPNKPNSNAKPKMVSRQPQVLQQNGSHPVSTRPLPKSPLKVIPLGGFGEIGKNILVYDLAGDIIVVDCGVMFPEEEMLGIDLVLPDVRYLVENKHRIKGWFFTHGHEDHIGSVQYIFPNNFEDIPVFAGKLTAGMIKLKLEEFGVKNQNISVVKAGDVVKLGEFSVEMVQVAHSIPDDLALFIKTKEGTVLHIPDWKIDHTPLYQQKTDLARLTDIGQEGVDLLLAESTNVGRPGYTETEQIVIDTFDKIVSESKGRVIVAMFASLINRAQQMIKVAEKRGRKVAISGHSMEKNVALALKLGYIKMEKDTLIDLRKTRSIADDKLIILATGAQGEEFSALSRMASGEHRQIKLKAQDTVVISASPIPGNEPAIDEVINNLFKRGANVIYGSQVDIHVSGHAQQEEMKLLLSIIQPKYFIPQHGEYRMLKQHASLARKLGTKQENIFVIENGQVATMEKQKVQILGTRVQAGAVLVDGLGVGDVGSIVLRDRQALAKDGIFVAIVTVDKQGNILTSPDIISRGFIYMRDREDLVAASRRKIADIFRGNHAKHPLQYDYIKKAIRDEMGGFLFKHTQRRPMVIPVVIQI